MGERVLGLRGRGLSLRVWCGRRSRRVARGRRRFCAAGRRPIGQRCGCGERLQKITAPVREGSPGRTAAVSRRGSTRNTVKTLEDRIEAARLLPQYRRRCAGSWAQSWLFADTAKQRLTSAGLGALIAALFAERPERLESTILHPSGVSLRWHKKIPVRRRVGAASEASGDAGASSTPTDATARGRGSRLVDA